MSGASLKNKKALEDNIQLAKALGAKIATVYGEDVAYQIAAYARGVKRIKNRPGKNESPDHAGADQRGPRRNGWRSTSPIWIFTSYQMRRRLENGVR